MRHCLVLVALYSSPALAPAADDVGSLYPDSAVFAFGVNVKAITSSPLGKKVIGTDKPFDATRKLIDVLLPKEVFSMTEKSLQSLETVANRIERITVAGSIEPGNPIPVAMFFEGTVEEDEYIKAVKSFAMAEDKPFSTEKLGDRQLLVFGGMERRTYGIALNKSLFVIATQREMIDEVVEKHAGKRKAKVQAALIEWIRKAKPAGTPMWLAVGELKVLEGIKGGVATITLTESVEMRMEVVCNAESLAATITSVLQQVVEYFKQERSPQAKVWNAAGITVKKDDRTVTVSGSIPGKMLAAEYSKRK